MASYQQLKEAEYIHRSEDVQLEGEVQVCGSLPCNYFEIKENGTENSYGYCNKHGMRVGCKDSCKYYDDSYYLGLISDYLKVATAVNKMEYGEKESSPQTRKQKENGSMNARLMYILMTLIGVCFLLFLTHGI